MSKQARRLPDNEPTSTATANSVWSNEENRPLVRFYLDLSAEKRSNGGKIRKQYRTDGSRVTQGDRCADVMTLVNEIGRNNRGKPDMKMQNISAILIALGHAHIVCPGFKPLPNVQTDRRAHDFDAMLWKAIDAEIAERAALARIASR